MGLFDRFRKKQAEEKLSASPEMLIVKLLFTEKPVINDQQILEELKKNYPNVEYAGKENSSLYFFPDLKIELEDAIIPAQCSILPLTGTNGTVTLPDEAFQQNWHWQNAKAQATACKYEILVSDLMTTPLEYKLRQLLFMHFLMAVVKVTRPQVLYSVTAQKLMQPGHLVGDLDAFINVRLFNITGGDEKDIIMDTVGLHTLGLPDWQVRFSKHDPSAIGNLLWNYVYYMFNNGNIIQDGNTIPGITKGTKWKCYHENSLVGPARPVINIVPE